MPVVRVGKTRKDHRNGSHGRRFVNRDTRVAWQKGTGSSAPTHDNFPWHTCNGKRNRTRWTARGNTTKTVTYRSKRMGE